MTEDDFRRACRAIGVDPDSRLDGPSLSHALGDGTTIESADLTPVPAWKLLRRAVEGFLIRDMGDSGSPREIALEGRRKIRMALAAAAGAFSAMRIPDDSLAGGLVTAALFEEPADKVDLERLVSRAAAADALEALITEWLAGHDARALERGIDRCACDDCLFMRRFK